MDNRIYVGRLVGTGMGPVSAAEKARVLVCAAVVGAFVGGYLSAPAQPQEPFPACADDSGASRYAVCVWDARAQGDGSGTSFVSVDGGAVIVYPGGEIVE